MKLIMVSGSVLIYLCSCSHAPKKPAKQEALQDKVMTAVVSEGKLHQEYIFKEVMKRGTLEYSVVYIGSVNTNKEIRKLLYETTLSGDLSPHANSHLIIYDGQNNKLGYYYISSEEAPEIKNDTLFFSHSYGDCNQNTAISLRDSIPEKIYIHCTEKGGDVYSFTTE